MDTLILANAVLFLSTLSLRRATLAYPDMIICTNVISIHALLAESDQLYINRTAKTVIFLSTLSLRRATVYVSYNQYNNTFLSTLSLRRATPRGGFPVILII